LGIDKVNFEYNLIRKLVLVGIDFKVK